MTSSKNESPRSLLRYYKEHEFNPVPLEVEGENAWQTHAAKRRNLYEKHLRLPLSMFKNKSVVEFGCNSGENALYTASLGAKMTLVEPNDQVLPRLRTLFKNSGLEQNIKALVNKDIDGFESQDLYDVMIAEGFLNTISRRDEMFLKICNFLAPGGVGIISFDDRHGALLEVTRQLLLKRACQLKEVKDIHSNDSLALAKDLFVEEFGWLNASRPFEAWWKDALINPFVCWESFWTYHDFIPLLEKSDCEFYSSSPKWCLVDHFSWYKNVPSGESRNQTLLEEWYGAFPFFLTGEPFQRGEVAPATSKVVDAVSDFIRNISNYVASDDFSMEEIFYPQELEKYLNETMGEKLQLFSAEMKKLYGAVKTQSFEELISTYHSLEYLRTLWGVPCPYICFIKRGKE